MKEYKIIAIMGKAGAGKDTLLKALLTEPYLKENAVPIVSSTTRPKRDYEIDGIDYHFLSVEDFKQKKMIETSLFNNWYYGTALEDLSLNKLNIGVFNPEGVESLKALPEIELEIIYIDANDKIRLLRQLNREKDPDCAEICRRYFADEKDFNDLRMRNIDPDWFIMNNGENKLCEIAAKYANIWAWAEKEK